MAVDTVLSKERSQNIAAQLNPDTTQSRVQQTRVSTRLVTQPRPDCSRLVSRLVTRVRLEKKKKKNLKARKRVGPGGGGGSIFFSFCIIILLSATDFSVVGSGKPGKRVGSGAGGVAFASLDFAHKSKRFLCGQGESGRKKNLPTLKGSGEE